MIQDVYIKCYAETGIHIDVEIFAFQADESMNDNIVYFNHLWIQWAVL